MKLHVGCGRDPLPGWTNLDIADWEGVDLVADITREIPLPDDSVDEILCSHVIEHIVEPLPAFSELWRVAKPGCSAEFHVPYGSSDLAWSDPTHVRPWFAMSWAPLAQPYHWRMEQGYRADWRADKILLLIRKDLPGVEKLTTKLAYERVQHERNVVSEMRAWLTAVKPARAPEVGWQSENSELVLEVEA